MAATTSAKNKQKKKKKNTKKTLMGPWVTAHKKSKKKRGKKKSSTHKKAPKSTPTLGKVTSTHSLAPYNAPSWDHLVLEHDAKQLFNKTHTSKKIKPKKTLMGSRKGKRGRKSKKKKETGKGHRSRRRHRPRRKNKRRRRTRRLQRRRRKNGRRRRHSGGAERARVLRASLWDAPPVDPTEADGARLHEGAAEEGEAMAKGARRRWRWPRWRWPRRAKSTAPEADPPERIPEYTGRKSLKEEEATKLRAAWVAKLPPALRTTKAAAGANTPDFHEALWKRPRPALVAVSGARLHEGAAATAREAADAPEATKALRKKMENTRWKKAIKENNKWFAERKMVGEPSTWEEEEMMDEAWGDWAKQQDDAREQRRMPPPPPSLAAMSVAAPPKITASAQLPMQFRKRPRPPKEPTRDEKRTLFSKKTGAINRTDTDEGAAAAAAEDEGDDYDTVSGESDLGG